MKLNTVGYTFMSVIFSQKIEEPFTAKDIVHQLITLGHRVTEKETTIALDRYVDKCDGMILCKAGSYYMLMSWDF